MLDKWGRGLVREVTNMGLEGKRCKKRVGGYL